MKQSFLPFFVIVSLVLILGSIYVGFRAVRPMPVSINTKRMIYLGLVAFVLIQIFGPMNYRKLYTPETPLWLNGLLWVTYGSLGFFALCFFLCVFKDLFLVLTKFAGLFGSSSPADSSRRDFIFANATYGIFGTAAVLTAYGFFQARRVPGVVSVKIPIKNLPTELQGFRIAQISDVHIGPTIDKDFLSQVVGAVNAQNPDLVAVTGDMVDGYVSHLKDQVQPLADLKAKFGSYFVSGNHEFYWGVDEWTSHFKSLGLVVLNNENRVLQIGRARLLVGGVIDHKGSRFGEQYVSDPVKAAAGAQNGDIKILLAHQPDSYLGASQAGFQLQLSGHTHGGQFFPWAGIVHMAYKRFTRGLQRYENLWVYTNSGTGYWGPPLRLGVPAEITLLELVAE